MSQIQRGLRFQQLHTAEAIFLMPNAWDVGSALMLASAAFPLSPLRVQAWLSRWDSLIKKLL